MNKDEIANLLKYLEYPELRQFCVANKQFANICKKEEKLISDKLEQYIDKIINNLQIKTGYYYRPQYGHLAVRYYKEPTPKDDIFIPIQTPEYDDTEYKFTYKGGYLNSLLPDRTFYLIYDYQYVYPRSAGIRLENERERKGKFILTETLNHLVSVLDRINYNPQYSKNVIKFKREGDIDYLRETLRKLLTFGFIG